MFSQSYNYLPNKKQSLFGSQPSQNMGLLRGLTFKSCQDHPDQIGMEFPSPKNSYNNNSFGPRTNLGLMDFVYSFAETSRIELGRRYIQTCSASAEKSKLNCKDIIGLTNCNTMTSPLVRSYLVGGFVGSKSQLGSRRKNDAGRLNLWDIIRDLVKLGLVGSAPANCSQRPNQDSFSYSYKKCEMMFDSMPKETPVKQNLGLNGLVKPISRPTTKQSYADVTKKRATKDYSLKICRESEDQHSVSSDIMCDRTMPVMAPVSVCNNPDYKNRDRIASECSADSEDSFIVFECSEDDNVDKDIFSSDDDTLSNVDEVSQSDSGIVPSSNSSFCRNQSTKKVRFAEDKSLVKIHPMVTWDYAYRMARRGPWEMLARDSERFKLRIARTEAVLKPILDSQHRSVVYRDRFSDIVR